MHGTGEPIALLLSIVWLFVGLNGIGAETNAPEHWRGRLGGAVDSSRT
jgi:hypothetical protein